jgi:hypothetical protein
MKCDLSKMPEENLEYEDGNQNFCKVIKMNKEIESKKRSMAV